MQRQLVKTSSSPLQEILSYLETPTCGLLFSRKLKIRNFINKCLSENIPVTHLVIKEILRRCGGNFPVDLQEIHRRFAAYQWASFVSYTTAIRLIAHTEKPDISTARHLFLEALRHPKMRWTRERLQRLYSCFLFAIANSENPDQFRALARELFEEAKNSQWIGADPILYMNMLDVLAKCEHPDVNTANTFLEEGSHFFPTRGENGKFDFHGLSFGATYFLTKKIVKELPDTFDAKFKISIIYGKGLHSKKEKTTHSVKQGVLRALREGGDHFYSSENEKNHGEIEIRMSTRRKNKIIPSFQNEPISIPEAPEMPKIVNPEEKLEEKAETKIEEENEVQDEFTQELYKLANEFPDFRPILSHRKNLRLLLKKEYLTINHLRTILSDKNNELTGFKIAAICRNGMNELFQKKLLNIDVFINIKDSEIVRHLFMRTEKGLPYVKANMSIIEMLEHNINTAKIELLLSADGINAFGKKVIHFKQVEALSIPKLMRTITPFCINALTDGVLDLKTIESMSEEAFGIISNEYGISALRQRLINLKQVETAASHRVINYVINLAILLTKNGLNFLKNEVSLTMNTYVLFLLLKPDGELLWKKLQNKVVDLGSEKINLLLTPAGVRFMKDKHFITKVSNMDVQALQVELKVKDAQIPSVLDKLKKLNTNNCDALIALAIFLGRDIISMKELEKISFRKLKYVLTQKRFHLLLEKKIIEFRDIIKMSDPEFEQVFKLDHRLTALEKRYMRYQELLMLDPLKADFLFKQGFTSYPLLTNRTSVTEINAIPQNIFELIFNQYGIEGIQYSLFTVRELSVLDEQVLSAILTQEGIRCLSLIKIEVLLQMQDSLKIDVILKIIEMLNLKNSSADKLAHLDRKKLILLSKSLEHLTIAPLHIDEVDELALDELKELFSPIGASEKSHGFFKNMPGRAQVHLATFLDQQDYANLALANRVC